MDPSSTVDVSLTTHGSRLRTVHLTLESIAAGSLLPRRVLLYLDAPIPERLPRGVERLRHRGLEIRESLGQLGPHTKYYLYVTEDRLDGHSSFVTADDDLVYPRDWLKELVDASAGHPGDVIAHRAHRIVLASDGVAPYNSWPPVQDREAAHDVFATGVSGVLYPPTMIDAIRSRGEGFRDTAPRADDVWLKHVALDAGIQVRQVRAIPRSFPSLLGTQRTSLLSINVGAGANDAQIRGTFTSNDVAVLRSCATHASPGQTGQK